jgi:UDP-N-acetyl-D-glucosamine dehydrogenase
MRVGIVGLGTIGREEFLLWQSGGHDMVGYDVNPAVFDSVAQVKPRLPHRLSTRVESLAGCSVVVLCLPTAAADGQSVSMQAFDSFVESASGLNHDDHLTIVASTVPIGFTRDLARRLSSDKVVHAPERYDPGRSRALGDIPRVIGGLQTHVLRQTIAMYQSLGIATKEVDPVEVAEASKLLENSFRLLNIAFINQFAALCAAIEISARDVIEAAATKPFGFMAHYPSAGAGGLCIPTVPRFLAATGRTHGASMGLLESAIELNDSLPETIAQRLEAHMSALPSARILFVGATYKPDYPEARGSSAMRLLRRIAAKNHVTLVDPAISSDVIPENVTLCRSWPEPPYDVLVIAVNSTALGRAPAYSPMIHWDLTRGELHVEDFSQRVARQKPDDV